MKPTRCDGQWRAGPSSLVLLASLLGCSGRPYDVAPVAGLVTLDGDPLAGGVVNFQPIAAKNSTSPGPGSTGRLDPDGRYVLELLDGSPGAVVGDHRVRIYSVSAEGPAATDTDMPGRPRERVPPRFNYQTELTITVPPAGTADADFSLTSDGR